METVKIYQQIAIYLNIIKSQKVYTSLSDKEAELDKIMKNAPSGSGFDKGTELDDSSSSNKLIFNTAFHHMDENGYYDGWTDHKVIITPSFINSFDMRISGRNRNNIKEYISDLFNDWLTTDYK